MSTSIIMSLIIFYIITTLWLYIIIFINNGAKNDDIGSKIIACCLIFTPYLNTFVIFLLFINFLYDKIDKFEENIKKRRLILKEREQKIKLGIIRISDKDPYGEENWNE